VLLAPVSVQGQVFEFLIDTGAAYTALSKDVVALLSIPVDPQRALVIAPAQGRTFRAPVITIQELRVGGFRIVKVAAVVLDFPQELRIDGILGMNVLRRFRLTIEADTGTLVLRRTNRMRISS
jgi:clan AA aspartic protease (TIGR02281 family)